MKKRKKSQSAKWVGDCEGMSGDGRKAAYERAVAAFEHESLFRVLEPLGRPDLIRELGRPLKAASVNEHPLFSGCYPLYLDVRANGASNPPPRPWSKPLPALIKMLSEFPGTGFDRYCLRAKVWKFDYAVGYAVIFAYGGATLILHSRPDLAQGPALVSQLLPNGCRVEIHWYEPFIDDVADSCRYAFAEEGSELMDRIESNYPFREAFWESYADRELLVES